MSTAYELEALRCRGCPHRRDQHQGGNTDLAFCCDVPGCGCSHYELAHFERFIEITVGTATYMRVGLPKAPHGQEVLEFWISEGGRHAWPTDSRVGELLFELHYARTRLYALESSLPRNLQPRSEEP